jgi:hypothetical protein
MRNLMLGLGVTACLLAIPATGRAQVHVGIDIGIAFPEPPPLVVVSPGIQIVPEYDEEVYFSSGWYWVRRDDAWYRTRDYRGHWAPVRTVYVPAPLMRMPPGQFRHYYRDDDGMWRPHREAEWHAWRDRHPWEERRGWWHQHRADQDMRREQDRSWREHERAWHDAERDRAHAERDREHAERDREHAEAQRDRHDRQPQPARYEEHRGAPEPGRGEHGGGHGHDRDHDHHGDH